MGLSDLEPDKQRKYDELKKKYQNKPTSLIPKKQPEPESLSDVSNSLQKQLEEKKTRLKEIESHDFFTDLKQKKQQSLQG